VALVGPNGAGKTTLLRALLGLVRHEGRIEIDGVDAARDPVGAKRRLGVMPQVPAFCEETARAALAFVAALRGAPPAEVDARLAEVGLAGHARGRVRNFSTGMRQRLSLAAALLGDPPVLVLDEPTASLDLRGQAEMVALLQRLQAEGRTILLSSHRAEEIRALAHRIVVLDQGHVIADGPVDRIAAEVWGAPPPRLVPLPSPRLEVVA
jgi:ABC-type multidrug transport system ATPase subunit